MADEFRRAKRHTEAVELYRAVQKNWPDAAEVIWCQQGLACSLIQQDDIAGAEAAAVKLVSDCRSHPGIAKAVCQVANQYFWAGRHTEANQLCEMILANWPESDEAMWSRQTLIRMQIREGDLVGSESAMTELLSKHGSHPGISNAIFAAGEEYYLKAQEASGQGNVVVAKAEYEKAIAIWQRIIENMPDSANAAQAGYLLALCYQRLGQAEKATLLYNKAVAENPALAQGNETMQMTLAGDHYCGAYVVWHLLKYYGKSVSVDEVSNRMGISQKGYATIKDIVTAFKYYDIDAQAAQISADKAALLDRPFVQYRITAGTDLGHFVLCIPDGMGKAVVLDGANESCVIDLSAYGSNDVVWDGTVVLISPSREEFIGKLVSAQIDWKTMMAMVECWMGDSMVSIDCAEKTGVYYAKLNEQKQIFIRGGCTKTDCKKNGNVNCNDVPACTEENTDEVCIASTYVCTQDAAEYTCQKVSDWFDVPCEPTQSHPCDGKRRLMGGCNDGKCRVAVGIYGDCNKTVTQCKN